MEKVYSTNDEEYSHTEPDEALQELADQDRLVEGAVYYECDSAPVELASYLHIDSLLDDAEARAYDELGECAEDAFSISKEAAEELDAAIKEWAKKHLSDRRFWKCVGKSREIRVTAEDIAAFDR